MKISHEYWYKYSHKGVPDSPHRQCVVRPAGLFLYNGLSVTRAELIEGKDRINTLDHTGTITPANLEQSFINNSNRQLQTKVDNEIKQTGKFCPEKYYSRLETPAYELDELQKRVDREKQVIKMKHLYHDDNFVQHSSALTKPKKKENSNMYLAECQRLWVPSHHKMRYLKTMWEKKVHHCEDVAYNQVVSTLKRDHNAFPPDG
jgi:hypothetical protein